MVIGNQDGLYISSPNASAANLGSFQNPGLHPIYCRGFYCRACLTILRASNLGSASELGLALIGRAH